MHVVESLVVIAALDVQIRNMLQFLLEETPGFRALPVEGFEDVVERVKVERPALVLVDVEWPEPWSLETIRGLKSSPETAAIPVIALTAPEEACDEARRAGSDVCVIKPFDLDYLLGLVRAHANRSDAEGGANGGAKTPPRTPRSPVVWF